MAPAQCIEAIKLVKELPRGRDAINQFSQSLNPKDRKMFNRLVNWMVSPLDFINNALEAAFDSVLPPLRY